MHNNKVTLASKLLSYAKRYVLGYGIENPELNGEFKNMRKLMLNASLVIEVGANIGNHMEQYIKANSSLTIHAFEPTQGSFAILQSKFGKRSNIILNQYALGSEPGEVDFQVYWETGGGNSFYFNDYQATISGENRKVVKVKVDTLDNYLETRGIEVVDFIKMDIEGHEYPVLLGLARALAKARVKVIQFEYSVFSKELGYPLPLIARFLQHHGFNLYRITPWGKLRVTNFKKWENYSANYLAVYRKKA